MPELSPRRADTLEIASALNAWMQIAADGEEAYARDALRVHDAGLKTLFEDKSQERARFLSALTSALLRIGAYAEEREAAPAAVGIATEHGDRALVLAWIGRERAAVAACRAISERTPLHVFREDLRAMLAGQYATIVADRELARRQLGLTP